MTSRRRFMGRAVAVAAAVAAGPVVVHGGGDAATASKGGVIELGSRRELFVDDYLIDSMEGVELAVHQPTPQDVVLTCDAPWEGNTSAYYTFFEDGGRYRVYYRGAHYDTATKKSAHRDLACYAESADGLVWERPKLGLYDFEGSKENNIIWPGPDGGHNFTPFKDGNPAASPEAKYKAFGGATVMIDGKAKACLHAYQSADGVRWSRMADAVITAGAFDSQNLAFWDAHRGEYRAYWRILSNKVRAIRTATSRDFVHWENQADVRYVDSPVEHLYTNAVRPYFRAPHLMIGFPTRFQPKTQQVEPVFMASRDGVAFRRSTKELIPITAPKDREGNRSNYMANGLLKLPADGERTLSVFGTEAYYAGPASRVRRFTFRTDGFVSARAAEAGVVRTKPFTFAGRRLSINVASEACRVEVQDAEGKAVTGFAAADCARVGGDQVDQPVTWAGGDLSRLAGKPVRLRFEIQRGDVYAFQFQA